MENVLFEKTPVPKAYAKLALLDDGKLQCLKICVIIIQKMIAEEK